MMQPAKPAQSSGPPPPQPVPPSVAAPPPETEPERQRRLVDMQASMQAALRDRYNVLGVTLLCIVLCGAAFAVAFAFAAGDGDEKTTLLGTSADRATWLGLLSVVIFALTLVELVVDLRGKAKERAGAVRALAALQGDYRAADLADPVEAERLGARYAAVTDAMPSIPERQFVRLKAAHLRKIELSTIVSCNPGIRPIHARWILWRRNL